MKRLRALSLAVFVVAAVAAAAGCGTQACKPKTMLLTIDYGALGSSIDSVEVQLSYSGETPSSSTLPHAGGTASGSIEIDFAAGYSAGRTLLVTVNGLSGGVVVATASQSFTLASSCTAETLTLTAGDGGDSGVGDDLGSGSDGSAADLAGPPPDLTGLVFPSNVSNSYLNASTADWTVIAQTVINTDGTDVASAFSPAPAAGVIYAVDGLFAVVAVHKLTVAANIALSAKGSRPLIIVAGDTIVVNGLIDGGGRGSVPGPSGAATMGTGHGGPGEAVTGMVVLVSGGGGGGYSSVGGIGGDVGGGGIGGTAGTTYGSTTLMPAVGGSAGGVGGKFSCATTPAGGAGGGYVQLSARTSITVAPFTILGSIPSGGISVGGGGGGSCTASDTAAGAGGGSGGSLLLESPTINCSGLLGATGGGGGSGSSPGADGLQITNPAGSSIGGAPTSGKSNGGGSGCNGVTALTSAQPGGVGVAGTSMAAPIGAGGGGGGFGRIYVRSSGTPMIMQSTPAATIDSTLPSAIP